MIGDVDALLEASVRTATPLALAALGETVVERAGVINIGLEGVILAGAFGALVGASAGAVGGVAAGVAAGVATAAVFALFALGARADQIIVGTAVTLLATGVTGTIYRTAYGAAGAALSIPTLAPLPIPLLSDLPLVGRALFVQPVFTYLVYLLIPALWWWMSRTHAGLALRAIGGGRFCLEDCSVARAVRRLYSRSQERLPKACRLAEDSLPSLLSSWADGILSAWGLRPCCSARRAHSSSSSRRPDGESRIRSSCSCPMASLWCY
jgi:simple sugar transport system permease protein